MILAEAIRHVEEVALEYDKLCKRYDDASGYSRSHNESIRVNEAKLCEKRAKEHRQLAEWLKDYMRLLEQEPCEDCISRQAVDELSKELVHTTRDKADFLCNFWEGLQKLPPVIPQPKTGHWEWVQYDYNPNIGNWHCSECKNIAVRCVSKNEKGGIPIYNYCPNCGAKMERSDKE